MKGISPAHGGDERVGARFAERLAVDGLGLPGRCAPPASRRSSRVIDKVDDERPRTRVWFDDDADFSVRALDEA